MRACVRVCLVFDASMLHCRGVDFRHRRRKAAVRSVLSPFLIGRTFASRIEFGVFDELRRGYIRGLKGFAQHVLGIFAQFDELCL